MMSMTLVGQQPNKLTNANVSDSEAESFFNSAQAAFADTASRHGVLERSVQIADKLIRLRFVGEAMLDQVMPPFAHLECEANPTDWAAWNKDELAVLIWDSQSTGAATLQPPWSKDDFSPFGQVLPCSSGRYRAVYESDGRLLSMTDLAANRAVYWARDSRLLPFHVLATPLRAILSSWLSQFGYEFAHAAAVGDGNGAVLIVGKGGSGKSSTALTSLEAGLSYLSDDYCLFSAGNSPQAFGVYSTAKIFNSDRPFYPLVANSVGSISCSATDKRLYFLAPLVAEKLARQRPIKALLFPRIGTAEVGLRQLTAKEAFLAIADSSSVLFPYSLGRGIGVFGDIARKIPAYSLDLGPDRGEVVKIISGLLEAPLLVPLLMEANNR